MNGHPPLMTDFLCTQHNHMIFGYDLCQVKSEVNPCSAWERRQTYNVVLCTFSGALLWNLLPSALLSVCGLWFSGIISCSSLTRELSFQVGLSCERERTERLCQLTARATSILHCTSSSSDLLASEWRYEHKQISENQFLC